MKKKSTAAKVISVIISVILSVFMAVAVLGILLISCVKRGFTREEVFQSAMASDNVQTELTSYIDKEIGDMLRPSGITKDDVLRDALKASDVKHDSVSFLLNTLRGTSYRIDTDEFQAKTTDYIHDFMDKNNFERSEENEREVKALVKEMTRIYTDSVKVPMAVYLGRAYRTIQSYFWPVIGILAGVILVCLVILAVNHRRIDKSILWLTYSLLAADIMGGVPLLIVRFSGVYAKLGISPNYFKLFVSNVIETFLQRALSIFGIFTLIVLLFIIISFVMEAMNIRLARKKASKKKTEHQSHGHHHSGEHHSEGHHSGEHHLGEHHHSDEHPAESHHFESELDQTLGDVNEVTETEDKSIAEIFEEVTEQERQNADAATEAEIAKSAEAEK